MSTILARCLLGLVLATGLAPVQAADAIVVPGKPALTRATQTRLVDFYEWIFRAPLNPEQRQRLMDIVVEEWQRPDDREGLLELLDAAKQVDALPAEQRPLAREQLLKAALPALKKSAKTDANARWFLGLYNAANKPLVAGKPALTRHAADATLELMFFMVGKGHGVEIPLDAAARDEWARGLAAQWPSMPAEQRQQIAQAPLTFATLRAAWDAAGAKDRATYAAQWKAAYPLPAAAAPAGASPAQGALVAKLQALDKLLAGPKGSVGAAQLASEADALDRLVADVRREGRPDSAALADRAAPVVQALRTAAAPPAATAAAPSTTTAAAGAGRAETLDEQNRRLRGVLAMQQAGAQMLAFQQQSFMRQSNIIATWGNSPYRYVNRFGNPY